MQHVSNWYRFLYGVGLTPWESATERLGAQIRELVAEEEARRAPPYGRALDVGCGTGRWSVELSKRGWQVVGVDVVAKAIRSARRRAEKAGAAVELIEGDVTRLRDSDVGAGFSLFLDVECFNHLNDSQRRAVGREVSAIASTDATLLLLAWKRAPRGPLPPGASLEDVRSAFSGWQVVEERFYEGELPFFLKNVEPRWYRLVMGRGGPAS